MTEFLQKNNFWNNSDTLRTESVCFLIDNIANICYTFKKVKGGQIFEKGYRV